MASNWSWLNLLAFSSCDPNDEKSVFWITILANLFFWSLFIFPKHSWALGESERIETRASGWSRRYCLMAYLSSSVDVPLPNLSMMSECSSIQNKNWNPGSLKISSSLGVSTSSRCIIENKLWTAFFYMLWLFILIVLTPAKRITKTKHKRRVDFIFLNLRYVKV